MPLGRFLKVLLGGVLALAILFVAAAEISGTLLPVKPSDYLGGYPAIQQAAWEALNAAQACAMRTLEWLKSVDHDVWLTLSTVLIAVFTGCLWWSTRKLWKAGERQLRVMQRSHLAVEPHGVVPLLAETHTIGRINIRNVGNVPAKNVRWFMNQDVSSDGMRKDFPITEKEFGQSNIVPPGIAMYFSQNNAISDEDANAIVGGAAYYFVWGIVRYSDVFGGDRFTRFCHRYGGDSVFRISKGIHNGKSGLSRRMAKYHQWGNETDEAK